MHQYFDLHTGIQWNRLSSDKNTFEPFSAASIELMGITWRPFANAGRGWRDIGFPMRASLLSRSFDAADFGAVPGTFKAKPEVQFQWGIVVEPWGHR